MARLLRDDVPDLETRAIFGGRVPCLGMCAVFGGACRVWGCVPYLESVPYLGACAIFGGACHIWGAHGTPAR
eukprot:5286222-Prymnesium_polylepis.1